MAFQARAIKYLSADGKSKLRIFVREGKRGFNVGASYWEPGMTRSQTGCQKTHETQAAAVEHYETLQKEATDGGWVPRASSGQGIGHRSKFTTIPMAPGAPADAVRPLGERVEGGDVVDTEGFVVDPTEEAELVPAGGTVKPGKKNGKKS